MPRAACGGLAKAAREDDAEPQRGGRCHRQPTELGDDHQQVRWVWSTTNNNRGDICHTDKTGRTSPDCRHPGHCLRHRRVGAIDVCNGQTPAQMPGSPSCPACGSHLRSNQRSIDVPASVSSPIWIAVNDDWRGKSTADNEHVNHGHLRVALQIAGGCLPPRVNPLRAQIEPGLLRRRRGALRKIIGATNGDSLIVVSDGEEPAEAALI